MPLILLILAAATGAHDSRCDSGLTDDLLGCAKTAYYKADATLNRYWKSVPHSPQQVKAQRAWLAWRDAECGAENYAAGGRLEDFVRLTCLADMTEQRVDQLQQRFQP
jgi:uncharacterized protein YecT (DUF1311 family)